MPEVVLFTDKDHTSMTAVIVHCHLSWDSECHIETRNHKDL